MRKESATVVLLMVSVILIAQLNVSGQAPILKTPKYCPTCADLPFRCEEIGLLVPEDTFHDMSEDVGVNVVYGEVVVYKEPDGFLPIVGATVFKLSQKRMLKGCMIIIIHILSTLSRGAYQILNLLILAMKGLVFSPPEGESI